MKMNRIKSCLTVIFAVGIFFGITTMVKGQIQVSNVPIISVIENLAVQAGINFIIDPKLFASPSGGGITEPQLTFAWTNISPNNALLRVLKENDLVLIEDKFTTIARITGTNQVANIVDASLLDNDTNDLVPTVRFQDVPLDMAFNYFVKQGRINVILDPKVSSYVDPNDPTDHKFHNAPSVSIHWNNVTPRQAIVALCENYDLVIVKDSTTGVIRIKPKD
jgi:hypothetical protein